MTTPVRCSTSKPAMRRCPRRAEDDRTIYTQCHEGLHHAGPSERKEKYMRRTLGLVVVPSSLILAGLPWPVAWAQAGSDTSLVGIEKKSVTLENFRLESGVLLPQVTLAYETYGALAPNGRNAILITHGYTSS